MIVYGREKNMLTGNMVETFVGHGGRHVAKSEGRRMTVDEVRRYLSQANFTHVKVGLTDLDGVLRGKHISKQKFISALDRGISFCDVIVGWDCNDQLYDNGFATGWHTGYPDGKIRIIPETMRSLPLEGGLPFFLCEFDGPTADVCPRNLLKRVLHRLEVLGYEAFAGVEYEFFMFNETPDSVRAKGYRNLETLTPGYFGYSLLRSSAHSELYDDLLDLCEKMEMPLEGLHTETGPGVIEAAIAYDGALRAADNAALFKTFVKVLAQRRKLMACFMAKWSEQWPGQSGHLHISLRSRAGGNAFHDADADMTISRTMRHFIGGMQKQLPNLVCMAAPTINAYTRLVPGYWAPTTSSWAVENRTAALRAIVGDASSQRIEYRIASADANPYLALSAALASGIWGIENEVEPTAPVSGNAYNDDAEMLLPTNLADAARNFKSSTVAKDLFGEAFVRHFAATREWEAREFQKHVTDWELKRYFEII
ncbi:glutamine synthetase [Bradyrhizobium sp. SZCCHNRI1003]|uniref:glutamine synthetase family protein n=1 Tax=Bradyrhizobium sp. SZCCHNRI1003 TaxID=3057275 RepID=UPI002916702B|nr:glutamine synthetase [Bradyrhizobium sp. SZCCHNRI1003]